MNTNINDRFGRLVVVGWAASDASYRKRARVSCDCGSPEKIVRLDGLLSGAVQSCGCLNKELTRTRASTRKRGVFPSPSPVPNATWIDLGDGQFALVDSEDADMINQRNWTPNGLGYAMSRIDGKGVKMHRLLCPGAEEVDHKNRNRLDNRKCNLRPCTRTQNVTNTPSYVGGIKGVWKKGNRWQSRIRSNGVIYNIGMFDTKEEAAIAYNHAARKHHGDFAWINDLSEIKEINRYPRMKINLLGSSR